MSNRNVQCNMPQIDLFLNICSSYGLPHLSQMAVATFWLLKPKPLSLSLSAFLFSPLKLTLSENLLDSNFQLYLEYVTFLDINSMPLLLPCLPFPSHLDYYKCFLKWSSCFDIEHDYTPGPLHSLPYLPGTCPSLIFFRSLPNCYLHSKTAADLKSPPSNSPISLTLFIFFFSPPIIFHYIF